MERNILQGLLFVIMIVTKSTIGVSELIHVLSAVKFLKVMNTTIKSQDTQIYVFVAGGITFSLFFENARDLNGVCENCGKRIHLTNTQKVKNKHSFCSRSCASQYNMKNKNRKFREDLNCTCTYCGKKFHRKKSAINKTNFCSKDCRTKYLKAQRVTFTCEMCGKVFDVPPSDVEHTRFCSRKCADDYQRRFCLHTKCAYCGNPIRVKSNTQARNKTGNYFCSNRCVGKFFSGENSPAYTGNSDVMKILRIYFALHQRQQVFVRDKKICQVCGGRATVVHHKYPLYSRVVSGL